MGKDKLMACYEVLEIDVELRDADKALLKKALNGMEGITRYANYDGTVSVTGVMKDRYFSGYVNLETGTVSGTTGMVTNFVALLKQSYAREAVNELANYGWDIEQTDNGVTLTQGGRAW
jgi:hypothetical protein